MFGRFASIRRQFSISTALRSPAFSDGSQSSRWRDRSRGQFERDRIKHPGTHRSEVAPRNEDFFNEANREFTPRKQTHKRWQRRQEFRQLLEAEAGTDEVAQKVEQQAPPDRRVAEGFLEDKVRRERRVALSEMARRKYYSYPIEDNLLTWKAKEQVFQLHQSDPHVWTPERLAESFPISAEGARRLLKRKWPPASTGEDEEEIIRKHDDEVRRRWILLKKGKIEDGLVSETTLNMVRSGEVKFLPMFAAGNTKLMEDGSQQEKADEFSPVIMPSDGPFVKLYKRHLQFLEKTSTPTSSPNHDPSTEAPAADGSGQASLHMAERAQSKNNPEELLRSLVFPEVEPGAEKAPMQFEQFRRQLEQAFKRSSRPQDRKYREWMMKNEGRKSGSGTDDRIVHDA